jgi:hypothetical protein
MFLVKEFRGPKLLQMPNKFAEIIVVPLKNFEMSLE